MRGRTALALVAAVGLLAALAVAGLADSGGGSLDERWVSDTPRDNRVNHHAVGVGPAGETVVAPLSEVPGGDVPLTDDSCALVRLAPADGAVDWRTGIPAADCFTHALTEPAIADVDRDGALEAVVASTEDAVATYDVADGSEEWRVPLSTYGYGRPTVANLTAAPGPEVVVSDHRGGVVVTSGTGEVAWRFDLAAVGWSSPNVWRAPVVADLDADGAPELLIASSRGPLVLSADGTVEWRRNGSATGAATADVDDDPAVEVFTAGTDGVRAYDGADGDTEWTRDLGAARVRTALDGDDDGTTELYLGRGGEGFLALDGSSGETEWETTATDADGTAVPAPVAADLDGDGGAEIVGVLSTGAVVALDPDTGAELARYERDVPVWTFPSPADLDGESGAELLVRYGDGRVVALGYD